MWLLGLDYVIGRGDRGWGGGVYEDIETGVGGGDCWWWWD